MAFPSGDAFIPFDPSVPIYGATIASAEIRENMAALANSTRGSQEPVVPAFIRGDVLIVDPVNLTTGYNIKVNIDGAGYTTVDLRSGGSSPISARTLTDIVAAINTAMGATVAFNLENYLLIRSTSTDPAVSAVAVDRGASNDAADIVLRLDSRSDAADYPFTVTGSEALLGQVWHSISGTAGLVPHGQRRRLKVGRPARLKGSVTGTVDTQYRRWIRLNVDGTTHEVDLGSTAVSRAATTIAEMAAAIDAAFGAGTAYDSGSGLLVVGTSTDPGVGKVELTLPGAGGGYGDATEAAFGFATGTAPKVGNLYPITDIAVDWSDNWMRVVEGSPGFGAWGPPAYSSDEIQAVDGVFDGEVRLALDELVLWVWREAKSEWTRLLGTQHKTHLEFSDDRKVLDLRLATIKWYRETSATGSVIPDDIASGDLIEVRDTRNENYPSATSSGVSLNRPEDKRDTFYRGDNASSLGTATSGEVWSQKSAKWGINSNRAMLASTEEDYAVLASAITSKQGHVAAEISIDATKNPSDTAMVLGVIFRAIDVDNCNMVYVNDRGSLVIAKRVAGVNTTLTTLSVDPPLDGTKRTLRVQFLDDANKTIGVFFGGKFDPTAWDSDLDLPAYIGAYALTSSNAINGNGVGIMGIIPALGKNGYVERFLARDSLSSPYIGYPPLPGHEIREIITSVEATDDASKSGIVNDCSPATPMRLRVNDATSGKNHGLAIKQDNASRTFLFKLGGSAIQGMMGGLHLYLGDSNGNFSDIVNRDRLRVSPGFACVPTGISYPAYEVQELVSEVVFSLNDAQADFKEPLGLSSPVANRFYYVYLAYGANGTPTVEYTLTAPNSRGIVVDSGKYMRFIGSFYYGNQVLGGPNQIRPFVKCGNFVRFVRPSNNDGLEGINGAYQFHNASITNNYDYNLGDTGSSPKGLIPATTAMCEMFLQVGAAAGGNEMNLRTSVAYGTFQLVGIDLDNDGSYTVPVMPDLSYRVRIEDGVSSAKAGVLGYYEDPMQLPGWLG